MPQLRAARSTSASTRLLNQLLRHAGAIAVALGVLVLISQLHMALLLAPLQPHVLTLQLAFEAPRFWQILAQWGPDGVQLYRSHFVYDAPHTLLYGAWGAAMVLGSGLFDGWSSGRRWLMAAVLPAAAVLDLLENAAHLTLLAGPPGEGVGLVPLAASCSLLKWLLLLFFLSVLLWRLGRVWWPAVAAALELRLPPLALGLACVLVIGLLARWLPQWRHPLPIALSLVPAIGGLVLAGLAKHALQRANTTLNPMQPDQARHLVTSGVYGLSRNPMYLGLLLVLAGLAAWAGQWLAGGLVLLVQAWLQRFQIVPEERALAAQFGPAFRLYGAQVRRWL